MCEFCENIRTYKDFETMNPYIIYECYCRDKKPTFRIKIPTDEGIDYSVDYIKFCPYCGRKLRKEELENKSDLEEMRKEKDARRFNRNVI